MDLHLPTPNRTPHGTGLARARRMALVLAGAAVFLGVASVIKPTPRNASADPVLMQPSGARMAHRGTQVPQHPKGWKLIGSLEGREHVVRCWATPEGPRYSVYALDGRLIQADLPADEVYRGFPDVDLENLRADPPGGGTPVMFVDSWRE